MNTKSGFVDIRVTWYRKSMRGAADAAAGRNRTKTKSLPLVGVSLNDYIINFKILKMS